MKTRRKDKALGTVMTFHLFWKLGLGLFILAFPLLLSSALIVMLELSELEPSIAISATAVGCLGLVGLAVWLFESRSLRSRTWGLSSFDMRESNYR